MQLIFAVTGTPVPWVLWVTGTHTLSGAVVEHRCGVGHVGAPAVWLVVLLPISCLKKERKKENVVHDFDAIERVAWRNTRT